MQGRLPGGGAAAMGGYELVRSDDAPALAVDLETSAGSKQAADGPSPARAQQRLVSLDVFRGITVLVRAQHSPSSSPRPPLLISSSCHTVLTVFRKLDLIPCRIEPLACLSTCLAEPRFINTSDSNRCRGALVANQARSHEQSWCVVWWSRR
jgi:hypothetical protein